jgi:hypothetical protein
MINRLLTNSLPKGSSYKSGANTKRLETSARKTVMNKNSTRNTEGAYRRWTTRKKYGLDKRKNTFCSVLMMYSQDCLSKTLSIGPEMAPE